MRTHVRRHHPIAACAFLLIAALAPRVAIHAETVFKRRSPDGMVAFQDHACAKSNVASLVEIAPPPPVAALTDNGHAPDRQRARRAGGEVPRPHAAKVKAEDVSYECRAVNGELFYRHGACPKQISAKANAAGGNGRARGVSNSQTYSVSAQALPRGDVCRQMARAGSIGRAGHERDENVSTYDRNLGRDPCRRF